MADKKKLKKEYRHLTNKQLSEKFNVSVVTIKKYLAQDRDEYLKELALRRAEMYKLKCDGLTLTEIAKKYNCTRHNVSLLIKKHKEQYNDQISMF